MDNVRTSEALNRRNSAFDNGLRPSGFSDFVGQAKIRDRLLLAVQAAKERGVSKSALYPVLVAMKNRQKENE